MNKTIAFRVDASVDIGTGHVIRCLTLADALYEKGFKSYFLCREHAGHLIELIRVKNHKAYILPKDDSPVVKNDTPYAAWLGTTQNNDARVSRVFIEKLQPTWLIVDHYALDHTWERQLRDFCGNLMAIDDLADRNHECSILLDQNLGRTKAAYINRVPSYCQILTGPHYALLRPEFAELRSDSLQRRKQPVLQNLLVSMGGVDKSNLTCAVLSVLREYALPENCKISIVVGATSPWQEQIRILSSSVPYPVEILTDVKDMAKLMVSCDLAIGAAGTTSWERCCLGVPSIIFVSAENQKQIAWSLSRIGAALIADAQNCKTALVNSLDRLTASEENLRELSDLSASICDGMGAVRVGEIIAQQSNNRFGRQ